MRNLSGSALTKIAEQFGNEPIIILDISWKTGTIMQYADRTVSGIKGKIFNVSNLDNVIQISKSDDSQEITVVLDDTDGTIKNIMNKHDIHKRDVWVYQYFEGLAITDRFLLFRGKINSPIIWNEGDQTVTITIVSQLEDKEVGFSPEEGQFSHIPRELIGKTWPSIFGTPLDVPAVQINKAVKGTTLCSVGIITGQQDHIDQPTGIDPPDVYLAARRAGFLQQLSREYWWHGFKWNNDEYTETGKEFSKQASAIRHQIAATIAQHNKQVACARARREQTVDDAEIRGVGCNPVRILGGEDFPRGTITLNINGGLFTGHFQGSSDIFTIKRRSHPEHIAAIAAIEADKEDTLYVCMPSPPPTQLIHWLHKYPWGEKQEQKFYYTPRTPGRTEKISQVMRHFWADAGSAVNISGNEPITYIVSIVPGTVLQVKAFKTFNGIQRLINVPSNMWTTETKQYGSITAVQVTVNKTLSSIEDQNWGDDIYVTFRSSIGPNIVDILTYLIQTYTDLQIDTTSFNIVKAKLAKFPANFALLDRKNILDVLSDIAFQSRCNLRLVNGKFYLTYLAEEPSTVDTITLDDIDNQSVEVFLTPTEDIVTKYTALWRLSYAQEDLNKIILRHNVQKYGIQEEKYDYYLYNQPDIIHKIATFWLIRKSNTWKRIKFRVFFNKLNLETFDAILLQTDTKKYVADTDVKAIIEQANIDGENYNIAMECWLPVKSGEMSAYKFAWPANVSAQWIFPTNEEIDLGLAGGDGIGRNATGVLPIGDVSNINDQTIYVGGINVIFGPQTDRGDKYPSDQGFAAQSLQIDITLADISVIEKPSLNLLVNYGESIAPLDLPEPIDRPFAIILEDTPVISTNVKERVGKLSDFLSLKIEEGSEEGAGTLAIETSAKFTEEDNLAPFHFKYDSEGEQFGAGTAFLKD